MPPTKGEFWNLLRCFIANQNFRLISNAIYSTCRRAKFKTQREHCCRFVFENNFSNSEADIGRGPGKVTRCCQSWGRDRDFI